MFGSDGESLSTEAEPAREAHRRWVTIEADRVVVINGQSGKATVRDLVVDIDD